MTNTYDTAAEALGSSAPKVLYNNASNMDEAMNLLGPSWTDRFGNRRQTWFGLEQIFVNSLSNLGYSYTTPLNYAAGIVLTAPNQIFLKDGEYYRAGPTITFPYTTTGVWGTEGPKFLSVGDAALRSALASLNVDQGVSLVAGAARVVDSIAVLKTLHAAGAKTALVMGYYGAGTRGGGTFSQYSLQPGEAVDNGVIVQGADGTYWKRLTHGTVYTTDFGAYADGTHDDTAAVLAWRDYGLRTISDMVISAGVHRITQAITFNFSGNPRTVGVTIRGEGGIVHSRLDFSEVPFASGTPCQFVGDLNSAIFYVNLQHFGITTNFNGPGVKIGRDDLTDAFNEGTIDLWINNNSQGISAETCRLNQILHYNIRLVCNGAGSGRPDSPFSPGYGTALVVRQAIMNTMFIAVGNASKGLYFTGGYSYGNFIPNIDIEEVNYGLLIDGVNCFGNTFVGGQWLALNLFNCTQGHGNKIINGNLTVYSGGVQNVNTVGLILERPGVYGIVTPAMSASGVYQANDSARAVAVNINGGSVSAIQVLQGDGGTASFPVGTWAGYQLLLLPGESIKINYTSAPSWLWRPAS